MAPPARPPRAKLLAAFLAVYLIWGSTFLAIRYAIETIPPFLMAGMRFLASGAVLYGWARWRGAAPPTRRHWASAAVIGALLLLTGNGLVVWAEQRVPSGVASLFIATEPMWIVLLDWLSGHGARPPRRVAAGVGMGLVGVGLLADPGDLVGGGAVDPLGAGVLLVAAFSWAVGSLYSRRAHLPPAPLLATAMQLLAGGVLLVAAAAATGELAAFAPHAVSARSLGALLYLAVFGSLVGYTAYIWLLRVEPPARVATYAYVNPVVAVLLGWLVAREPLGPRTIAAASVIIGAVAMITLRPRGPRAGVSPPASAPEPGIPPSPSGRRTAPPAAPSTSPASRTPSGSPAA